jgi:hypothetical protein
VYVLRSDNQRNGRAGSDPRQELRNSASVGRMLESRRQLDQLRFAKCGSEKRQPDGQPGRYCDMPIARHSSSRRSETPAPRHGRYS